MSNESNRSKHGGSQPIGAVYARCAVYARFSSDLQRDASTQDQFRNCRGLAARKNWNVVDEYVRSDEGISGASLEDRKGLLELIAAAKQRPRPFDRLLVDDTSRLARNLEDAIRVVKTLEFCGVHVVSVTQGTDTQDRSSRSLIALFGLMDEEFLIGLADKVHRGQLGRILEGYTAGGKSYGYKNHTIYHPTRKGIHGNNIVIGVELLIIEEEAAVVRLIFELYEKGHGFAAIAKTLNSRGIASPSTRNPWGASSIKGILHNERYHGWLVWNRTRKVRNPETGRKEKRTRPADEWVRVHAPDLQIVTEEQWERVQQHLKQIGARFRPYQVGGFHRTARSKEYLFSGLLFCGQCGAKINVVVSRAKKSGGRYIAYGCHNYRFCGTCSNSMLIGQETLEQQLLEGLCNLVLQPERLELAVTEFQRQLEKMVEESKETVRKTNAESDGLKKERTKLAAQARNIADAIKENGHHQSPTLLSELMKIESRIEAIDHRLNQSNNIPELTLTTDELREFVYKEAENLKALLQGDRFLAKQEIAKRIGRVVLTPKETDTGRVCEVSGDIHLLAGDPRVLPNEPLEGIAEHYTGMRIPLTGVVLDPSQALSA